MDFHSASFENQIFVPVEWVETAISNPRIVTCSFNPFRRYRKSNFQKRRYEKNYKIIENEDNIPKTQEHD